MLKPTDVPPVDRANIVQFLAEQLRSRCLADGIVDGADWMLSSARGIAVVDASGGQGGKDLLKRGRATSLKYLCVDGQLLQ